MRYFFWLAFISVTLGAPGSVWAYELVILNGRVMDPETGFDAVTNVGVDKGRIKAITDDAITGLTAIDASDLVVTAGFIELLERPPEATRDGKSLRDGITSAVILQAGSDEARLDDLNEELRALQPQTVGSHAAALRLARERDMPLMPLLATFSYAPAKAQGDAGLAAMRERGRLQEGMIADITVFDPDTVTDPAPDADGSVGTGIPYVIVSGIVAVREGRVLTDAFPAPPGSSRGGMLPTGEQGAQAFYCPIHGLHGPPGAAPVNFMDLILPPDDSGPALPEELQR